MKKILTAITVAVFIIYPSICFASYVIHLKDGREFVTDRYWEEGDQIKFKRYGGAVGIQKDQVKEIEEVEALPEEKEKVAKPEAPLAQVEDVKKSEVPEEAERVDTGKQGIPEGAEKEAGAEEEQSEKDESEEKSDDEQLYKNQRIALSLKVREALESYKRAKELGDRDRITEEFRRVSQISSELGDLEKEVKARNGGILPSWWREEPERRE